MPQPDTGRSVSRSHLPAFLAGVLTSSAIAVVFVAFLVITVGPTTVLQKIGISTTGMVLDITDDLIEDMKQIGAVVGNANNPTGARKHDTILVRPDDELGYVLRPNTSVSVHLLKARDPLNLDPPGVYFELGAEVPPRLRDYLNTQSRVELSYTVDEEGFRLTLPRVESHSKILMVGDSALFGVGVNDESTLASYLQGLVGDSYRVVNAGVGGYSGHQSFQVARKLGRKGGYDVLIYVAHHNDFHIRHVASAEKADEIISEFRSLTDAFPGGIVIALVTYMEYTLHDVLLESGWRQKRIDATDDVRRRLRDLTAEAGFVFVDWTEVANDHAEQERTIFSKFGLYVDHSHLSPRGNLLFAERIYERMFRQHARSGARNTSAARR
jgi:hypothetical protein